MAEMQNLSESQEFGRWGQPVPAQEFGRGFPQVTPQEFGKGWPQVTPQEFGKGWPQVTPQEFGRGAIPFADQGWRSPWREAPPSGSRPAFH